MSLLTLFPRLRAIYSIRPRPVRQRVSRSPSTFFYQTKRLVWVNLVKKVYQFLGFTNVASRYPLIVQHRIFQPFD